MAAQRMKQRIGFRIIERRRALGFTALELADRAGVHRNTIYRIEAALSISLESLWSICQALQITIDSLMENRAYSPSVQLELWPVRKHGKSKL